MEASLAVISQGLVNVKSSSNFSPFFGVDKIGLNYRGPNTVKIENMGSDRDGGDAWVPAYIDDKQFVLLTSETPREYMKLLTQGRGDYPQWVTSFTIRYSLDNVNYFDYKNGAVLPGNSDSNTVVTTILDPPIYARSISIHPKSWSGNIAFRMELYAAPREEPEVYPVEIDTGRVQINNQSLNTPGGPSSGYREARVPVHFKRVFVYPPQVHIGLVHIDSKDSPAGQTRVLVEAQEVTNCGFVAVFKTWNESSIYDAAISYLAIANGCPPCQPPHRLQC
eukprot:gene2475-3062_t